MRKSSPRHLLKKVRTAAAYLVYALVVLVAIDVLVLRGVFGLGYPMHYEQADSARYPAPYVAFTGRPNAGDHNKFGFRGRCPSEAEDGEIRVAFFAGSTGYNGNPPIAEMLETKLEGLLGESVCVANFSVVGSHHRQHLHGMIEFLPDYRPDLIVFYGGYNETILNGTYDPRPGYPYNHFYRAETGPFARLLLENSAIIGEIDKRTGIFSGIEELRDQHRPFSDAWNRRIAEKYFETLMLASRVAGAIDSNRFGTARFLAFYQPYQVPPAFAATHNDIRRRLEAIDYAVDVSAAYDASGDGVFVDHVHVNQRARELMAAVIADVAVEVLRP